MGTQVSRAAAIALESEQRLRQLSFNSPSKVSKGLKELISRPNKALDRILHRSKFDLKPLLAYRSLYGKLTKGGKVTEDDEELLDSCI